MGNFCPKLAKRKTKALPRFSEQPVFQLQLLHASSVASSMEKFFSRNEIIRMDGNDLMISNYQNSNFERLFFQQISHLFSTITQSSKLHKWTGSNELNISFSNLYFGDRLGKGLGKMLKSGFSHLRKLTLVLEKDYVVSTKGIEMLCYEGFPHLTKLESLTLVFMKSYSAGKLLDDHLKSLGSVIGKYLVNLKQLELKIQNKSEISNDGILTFLAKIRPISVNLTAIGFEFRTCAIDKNGLDNFIKKLCRQCPNLELFSLELGRFSNIGNGFLRYLGIQIWQNLSKLRQLRFLLPMYGAKTIDSVAFFTTTLASMRRPLQKLSLGSFREHQLSELEFVISQKMPKLQRLVLFAEEV